MMYCLNQRDQKESRLLNISALTNQFKEKRVKKEQKAAQERRKERKRRNVTIGEAMNEYEVKKREIEERGKLLEEVKKHKESLPKKVGREKYLH